MDRKQINGEQSISGFDNTESIIQRINNACCKDVIQALPTEIQMKANNLNVTLRFAEKPNSDIQESVLRVLVGSYKARVVSL